MIDREGKAGSEPRDHLDEVRGKPHNQPTNMLTLACVPLEELLLSALMVVLNNKACGIQRSELGCGLADVASCQLSLRCKSTLGIKPLPNRSLLFFWVDVELCFHLRPTVTWCHRVSSAARLPKCSFLAGAAPRLTS